MEHKFEVTPLASLWFHVEPQGCVKTVHFRSLAYKVATALKFCRNIIKHSRLCRPRTLGSMINMEAAREGGRSKLRTHFSHNPYGKKLPNLYQSLGIISSVEHHMKNCWENCGSMLRAFTVIFQQVSGAQNGQVESFLRATVGNHWGAGGVL